MSIAARCQSCALRLNEMVLGTELDGADSTEFCSRCYTKGNFTKDLSFDDALVRATKNIFDELPVSKAQALELAQEALPGLKRWSIMVKLS